MTRVIILCGAKKAWSGRPASHLYEGTYFRACRAPCRSVAGDDVRILSAKHGLVSSSASLGSNDTCFGQEGRISHDELARQAKALGWRPSAVIALGDVITSSPCATPSRRLAPSPTRFAEANGADLGRQIGRLPMNRSRPPL